MEDMVLPHRSTAGALMSAVRTTTVEDLRSAPRESADDLLMAERMAAEIRTVRRSAVPMTTVVAPNRVRAECVSERLMAERMSDLREHQERTLEIEDQEIGDPVDAVAFWRNRMLSKRFCTKKSKP